MSNSYGFQGEVPDDAQYGVFDIINGEMVGIFFADRKEAEVFLQQLKTQAADDPDDWKLKAWSIEGVTPETEGRYIWEGSSE